MNSITKKTLLVGFALLSSACAPYPQHYSYYPSNAAYSSGYTIMHRNYYGERPDHYDNGYGSGNAYFPHHHRHDQYNAPSHRKNDYSGHRQHDRNNEHFFNYGNRRQRSDDGDNHHNDFDRRNHH